MLALPAAAAALGGAVIGLQYLGVGHRPLPSTLILLAGIAAGVAPLRFGLPLAAGLACFQTTIDDFFGPPGRYWKEAFVAILVLRALRRRWLRPGEAAVAAVVALVYIAYLATGTSLLAVGWAAKILFFALVAGWALVRLGAGRAEWTATYYALVVAAGANVVLGVWQRIEGWHGLLRLGLPYGERVRQAPTGAVRAFGGLTTAAPFAYVLALVVLAWVAFLVAEPGGRRLALNTIWVPPVALAGIALSLDRIALVGLTATILLGSLFRFRRRPALALIALAPVVVGLVLVLAGPSSRSFLLEGFTFSSHSAKARRLLWSEYADELNILGRGPASAGAAYERSLRNTPVTQFARGWYAFERDPSGGRFRWMTTRGGLLVGVPGRARRRALLTLVVASTSVDRTLTVSYGRLVLAHQLISTTENTTVPAVVPSGRGRALVQLATQPPAFRSGAESPHDKRRLSIRLDSLSASDAGPPDRTAAIYARVRQRAGVEALQGTAPGVVDNLYLSWLFQYGYLLGGALRRPVRHLGVRAHLADGSAPPGRGRACRSDATVGTVPARRRARREHLGRVPDRLSRRNRVRLPVRRRPNEGRKRRAPLREIAPRRQLARPGHETLELDDAHATFGNLGKEPGQLETRRLELIERVEIRHRALVDRPDRELHLQGEDLRKHAFCAAHDFEVPPLGVDLEEQAWFRQVRHVRRQQRLEPLNVDNLPLEDSARVAPKRNAVFVRLQERVQGGKPGNVQRALLVGTAQRCLDDCPPIVAASALGQKAIVGARRLDRDDSSLVAQSPAESAVVPDPRTHVHDAVDVETLEQLLEVVLGGSYRGESDDVVAHPPKDTFDCRTDDPLEARRTGGRGGLAPHFSASARTRRK